MAAKMRYAARDRGIDINIKARSESEVMNYVDDVDAVMVGPHLSMFFEDIKKRYEDEFVTILMKKDYYANLDGAKALDHLLSEIEHNTEKEN